MTYNLFLESLLFFLLKAEVAERNVGFKVISDWRVNGWAEECYFCKKEIISDDYGWFPHEHDGKYELTHVTCSEPII